MAKKKSITIDTLARMMQKEFLATRHEIKSDMTKKFNKVNDDISYLHSSFSMLDRKIDEVGIKLSKKMDEIIGEVKDIRVRLEKVIFRPELEIIERRVAKIEKSLGIS